MDAVKKPIFRNLHADDDPEATEIQSLCMSCFKDVSMHYWISFISFLIQINYTGYYTIVAYKYSILQRSNFNVILM